MNEKPSVLCDTISQYWLLRKDTDSINSVLAKPSKIPEICSPFPLAGVIFYPRFINLGALTQHLDRLGTIPSDLNKCRCCLITSEREQDANTNADRRDKEGRWEASQSVTVVLGNLVKRSDKSRRGWLGHDFYPY